MKNIKNKIINTIFFHLHKLIKLTSCALISVTNGSNSYNSFSIGDHIKMRPSESAAIKLPSSKKAVHVTQDPFPFKTFFK